MPTVLWDNLEEHTDLFLSQQRNGQTSNCPLKNDPELLMELGSVLVPIPALGLLFVAHLLDHILLNISLKAGSVNQTRCSWQSPCCSLPS